MVAACSSTTLPWEAPVEVTSPAGTSLSFRKVTWSWVQEALPVAGSHWATYETGDLKRELLPCQHHGLHLFTMQHKALWSALEYTCRLLGISTAAGKCKLSFSFALKGSAWVSGTLSCFPAFEQVQPLPHPARGTGKLNHFCFGTHGVQSAGCLARLFPNAVGGTVRHQKG